MIHTLAEVVIVTLKKWCVVIQKGKGKAVIVARETPRGKGTVLYVDRAQTNALATETALSTKPCQKEAHSDSPVEESISDSESGEDIADGDSSDSENFEIDSCTCGAEVRAHKRGPTREAVP